MKTKTHSLLRSAILIAGAASLLGHQAQASVLALQNAQAANGSIVYQYTFDGLTPAERLDQKISPNTPDLVAFKTTGYANDVGYVPSYGNSTDAARVYGGSLVSGTRSTGAALKSAADLSITSGGTIEFLVNPISINDQGFAVSLVPGGTNNRFRPLTNGAASSNIAYASYGNNTGTQLIGGTTGVTYAASNWYYVAQSWSISGAALTLNAWVSDLSAPTPTLVQTITNLNVTWGGTSTGLLRLGSGSDAGNFFNGSVDAVAIYNTALSASAIQSNFNVIPEPSTVALALGGLLGVLALRRRKLS